MNWLTIAVSDFRPDVVIKAYWCEILNIREDDELLDVEYVEKEEKAV